MQRYSINKNIKNYDNCNQSLNLPNQSFLHHDRQSSSLKNAS